MAHDPSNVYGLIDAAAAATGLDWWLLYGVIEQESQFDPACESDCGAIGLMQLMPSSFPAFSRSQLFEPATNVRLGSEFLRELIAMWRLESADEALRFGLACYNGGPGYVSAAQRMAAAAGANPALWSSVQPFLAGAVVGGKRPDVEQITDYVHRIWSRFVVRREQRPPGRAA